ncbi:MAG: hypothetical protein ABEJ76_07305 [Halanaeroarchaeum sp.]
MALENLTVLEFHLHTGSDEPEKPPVGRSHEGERPAAESSAKIRAPTEKIALALLVSVALSAGVAIAVRRLRRTTE